MRLKVLGAQARVHCSKMAKLSLTPVWYCSCLLKTWGGVRAIGKKKQEEVTTEQKYNSNALKSCRHKPHNYPFFRVH